MRQIGRQGYYAQAFHLVPDSHAVPLKIRIFPAQRGQLVEARTGQQQGLQVCRQNRVAQLLHGGKPRGQLLTLLRPITAHFDGYVERMMRVSSTCLVRADRNRYSVPANAAGQAVSVRTTADQVRIVAHGEIIAAHSRVFGREQLVCDPWHYLPVLEKKPGALRDGAPFVAWDLPRPIQTVRDRILKHPKGNRAFVELLESGGCFGKLSGSDTVMVRGAQGISTLRLGDWVVRGENNQVKIYTNSIFHSKYELA